MYCIYDNGIGQQFDLIPAVYRNVSGFNLLTNADRAAMGFYPIEIDKPDFDSRTHTQVTMPLVSLNGAVVDMVYPLTAKSLDTVKTELIATGRSLVNEEILAEYPVYKQLNREVPGRLTQQEIDAMDAFIDGKRSVWNTKEAAIQAATSVVDAVAAFEA